MDMKHGADAALAAQLARLADQISTVIVGKRQRTASLRHLAQD